MISWCLQPGPRQLIPKETAVHINQQVMTVNHVDYHIVFTQQYIRDATSPSTAEEKQKKNVYVHWHNCRLLHLDCNVVVRQNSRGTRETVWMPYYSVWSGSGSREGEKHVSVTEAETDESSAQSSRKRRHMTQLITAHHPGRDRIQAASPLPSCIFKHLHTVLLQLKNNTRAHIYLYMWNFRAREPKRWSRGWPHGKILSSRHWFFLINRKTEQAVVSLTH